MATHPPDLLNVKIEKLRGPDNYRAWSLAIEEAAYAKGLLGYLTGDIECPSSEEKEAEESEEEEEEETSGRKGKGKATTKPKASTSANLQKGLDQATWANGDRKAFYFLRHYVELSVKDLISPRMTSKEVWDLLKETYQVTSDAEIAALDRRMRNLVLTRYSDIDSHLQKLTSCFGELAAMGEKVRPVEKARILINSLDERKFAPFIQTASFMPASEKTFPKLQSRLRSFVPARTEAREPTSSDAFYSKGDAEKDEVKDGRRDPREGEKRPRKFRGRCFSCGKIGHKSVDCEQKKEKAYLAKNDSSDEYSAGSAFYAATVEDEPENVAALARSRRVEFTVDSGATDSHMKEAPLSCTPFPKPKKIRMAGEGMTIESNGKGDVPFVVTATGQPFPLRNVHHTPKMTTNLLSANEVVDGGSAVIMRKSGGMIVNDDDLARFLEQVKLKGVPLERRERSWRLVGDIGEEGDDEEAPSTAMVAKSKRSLQEWHEVLGHVSRGRLIRMAKKEMLTGFSIASILDPKSELRCEPCAQAKATRQPFPKSSETRASKPLALIHLDLAGPFAVRTNKGARYYLVIVDDHTRYVWVEFLKHKSDAVTAFARWKTYQEKRLSRKVTVVRTDRGGEFIQGAFEKNLRDDGIEHQYTMARTPEQNGVAERANRTLKDGARAGKIAGQLPAFMWAQLIYEAARHQNAASTRSLDVDKSPHEMLFGTKPSVSDEHRIGCRAWVHVAKEDRPKGVLTPRAEKGWYVGRAPNSKGFRVLTYRNGAPVVVESRDVQFWDEKVNDEEDDGFDFEETEAAEDDEDAPSNGAVVEPAPSTAESHETTAATDGSDSNDEAPNEDEASVERPVTRRGGAPQDGYYRQMLGGNANLAESASRRESFGFAMMAEMVRPAPKSRKEAMSRDDWPVWRAAEEKQMAKVEAKETLQRIRLEEIPTGAKIIPTQMVYGHKFDAVTGLVAEHTSRLVARGDLQVEGEHFDPSELSASPPSHDAFRTIIAHATRKGYQLYGDDAVAAYLNSKLDVPIFVRLPDGSHAKLLRALYGLRQSGRRWWSTLDEELVSLGFERLEAQWGLYRHREEDIMMAVYVDDFLVAFSDSSKWKEIHGALAKKFAMKGAKPVESLLGISIKRDLAAGTTTMASPAYVDRLLEATGMTRSNAVATPLEPNKHLSKEGTTLTSATRRFYQEVLGKIMWLAATTRPDLSTAAGILGQFSADPKEEHWTALKRVLRYLRGATHLGIQFGGTNLKHLGVREGQLVGFSDADWSNDVDDSRSRSGYLFFLDGPISWASRKQTMVSLSTTEAEYLALNDAARHAIFLDEILSHLRVPHDHAITILEDNDGAEKLTSNPAYHPRTKHFRRRIHWIRERVADGDIKVRHVGSKENLADAFTKQLGTAEFKKALETMGMVRL
ncbi:hypothetical protein JCM5296_003827 [Sporobolomyces johnsonii]